MKQFFEEPKLCVEQFTVADVLTNSSWWNGVGGGENESPVVRPFSSADAFSQL